jgi:hypothetical protein
MHCSIQNCIVCIFVLSRAVVLQVTCLLSCDKEDLARFSFGADDILQLIAGNKFCNPIHSTIQQQNRVIASVCSFASFFGGDEHFNHEHK